MHFHQLCKGTSQYLVNKHVKAHGLKLFLFTSHWRVYLWYFGHAGIRDVWQLCLAQSAHYTLAAAFK